MNGNTGRWVGIDVAKSKLDVALLDERGKFENYVFANSAKGHAPGACELMTLLRCLEPAVPRHAVTQDHQDPPIRLPFGAAPRGSRGRRMPLRVQGGASAACGSIPGLKLSLCVSILGGLVAPAWATPSPDATPAAAVRLAQQVLASSDHDGQPFAVVDKKAAVLTIFLGNGQLVGSTQVLLGKTTGDRAMPGVGEQAQRGQLRTVDRVTHGWPIQLRTRPQRCG